VPDGNEGDKPKRRSSRVKFAADAQAPATEPDESIKVAAAAATDSTK
jgi:hypothetical protein